MSENLVTPDLGSSRGQEEPEEMAPWPLLLLCGSPGTRARILKWLLFPALAALFPQMQPQAQKHENASRKCDSQQEQTHTMETWRFTRRQPYTETCVYREAYGTRHADIT